MTAKKLLSLLLVCLLTVGALTSLSCLSAFAADVDTSDLEASIQEAEAFDISVYAPCDELTAFLDNLQMCKDLLASVQNGDAVFQGDIDNRVFCLKLTMINLSMNGTLADTAETEEGATEPETEAPTEPETTEPETEAPTEPETEAPTEPETEVPTDAPATEAPTDAESETAEETATAAGCGSALALGSLWALVIAALGCLAVSKRR